MRIALTGAPGIGKTTLARAISKEYGLPLIAEDLVTVTRAEQRLRVSDNSGSEDERTLVRAYVDAGRQWLSRRQRAQDSLESFVADRFAVDMLAMWMIARINPHDDDWHQRVIKVVQHQSTGIDLVIIPPLVGHAIGTTNEFGIKRNGHLRMRLYYQSLILGLTKQLLEVPIIYLPTNKTSTNDQLSFIGRLVDRNTGSIVGPLPTDHGAPYTVS